MVYFHLKITQHDKSVHFFEMENALPPKHKNLSLNQTLLNTKETATFYMHILKGLSSKNQGGLKVVPIDR